jgi:hypothetical protein
MNDSGNLLGLALNDLFRPEAGFKSCNVEMVVQRRMKGGEGSPGGGLLYQEEHRRCWQQRKQSTQIHQSR